MSYSTVAEFAERYDADNAGDQTNFTDFYNMMTKQALPLMQEGTAAAYDEVYALIMKGGYWTKCGWRVDSVQIIKGDGSPVMGGRTINVDIGDAVTFIFDCGTSSTII